MTRDELFDAVRRALEPYPEVLDAYVFGSVGRGTDGPASDVDVAVTLSREAPEPAFGWPGELAAAVMAALRRNDVDLVVLNRASPLLQHRVLRDGVRVFTRDVVASTSRAAQMVSRWCDWAPVQARIDAAILGRGR